jgi:hypothetical protein
MRSRVAPKLHPRNLNSHLAEQPHHQVSKIPGAVAETQLPHRLYPSIGNTQQETFFS